MRSFRAWMYSPGRARRRGGRAGAAGLRGPAAARRCPRRAEAAVWGPHPAPSHPLHRAPRTHDQGLQPVVQVAVEGELLADEARGLLQRRAGCPREGPGVRAGRGRPAVCCRAPLRATAGGLVVLLPDRGVPGAAWMRPGRGRAAWRWSGALALRAWALAGRAPGRRGQVQAGAWGLGPEVTCRGSGRGPRLWPWLLRLRRWGQ